MSFKNADKKYVDRHTDQSKATADRLERGAERVTRREGKQEIAEQVAEQSERIHAMSIKPAVIITLKNGDKKRFENARLTFNYGGVAYVYSLGHPGLYDRILLAVAPGEWLCAEETDK